MRAAKSLKFIKQQSNSGSALVTVIVSMVFVIVLGASLLFSAYASYSIQLAQRTDKTTFYSAETVMDELRLGVQTLLSESMASAYTTVMAQRLDLEAAQSDPQLAFGDEIVAQLLLHETPDSTPDNPEHYFSATLLNGKMVISAYNAGALAEFSGVSTGNATISGTENVTCEYDGNYLKSISLKGISVKYISKGFESNITSDITVTVPLFYTSSSITSAVNNYAIIANNSLIHKLGVGEGFVKALVNIDGSVFAGTGGIELGGNGHGLNFTNCNLISKGEIEVSDSGRLNFTALHYELWTDGLLVGDDCTLTLDAKVHVADDLQINGSGATVTLKNSYFGFGNSSTASERSSAIVINGRNATLRINELSKLSLAGISFIDVANSVTDTGGTVFSSGIPMGQSMSVRSDQLAYLLPVQCIKNYATNPFLLSNTETFTWDIDRDIDRDAVLWTTSTGAKTLTDYIGAEKGTVKTLFKPLDSTKRVAYVFLLFSNKAAANTYFKDYFAADPSKIQQYLNLYLTLTSKAANAKFSAVGNTYALNDKGTVVATDDELTLVPAGSGVWADGEQLLYNGMLSPYLSFVNTVNLNKLSNATLPFKDAAGNVVAIVNTQANYAYTATSADSLRLILSTQNVTIADTFTGIIIAGGNVIANADITGAPLDPGIMDATYTDEVTTYKLSDFISTGAQFGSASGSSSDQWNLDTLVYYENWNKH